jgi:hypothetical protein
LKLYQIALEDNIYKDSRLHSSKFLIHRSHFLHRQGDDDRRATMRTRPRMVADLPAAFVTFDESHII